VFLQWRKIVFILKTRYAICCDVNFYNAGVVTRDHRIGSWKQNGLNTKRIGTLK
jgi:hypothetical protein